MNKAKLFIGLTILIIGFTGFIKAGNMKPVPAETGLVNKPPLKVKTYKVFEINMAAVDPGNNPYINGPEVSALFTGPDRSTYRIKGYWDGDNIFSVRFSPMLAGNWTYSTSSSDQGLNGITGSFKAIKPTTKELSSNNLYRGFLVAEGYSFTLSDGTPFLPVGETQWSFSEEFHTEEWKDWMKVLNHRGYNSFLGCIWLALYNRAGILPFNGSPQEDTLNEAYFDRLDEWVKTANENGIIMGLTIGGFPDNSRWFSLFNTRERNDRWFQYCVRRYAAFNVRWVLYGEVDEMNPSWATWEENTEAMAQLVRDEDPYDHPIGSHHRYIDRATARSQNIDYLCIQSNRNSSGRMGAEYQYLTTIDYRQYGKPLWFEEYWYENAEGLKLGIQNTYRNFIAGMAFPTMGSLMRGHEKDRGFVPESAKNRNQSVYTYLMESDSGIQCMQYFFDFFADLNIMDFSPASEKIKNPGIDRQCGRFGNSYVIFMENGGQVQLDLTNASGRFSVEQMDIISGERKKLKDIEGGSWQVVDSGDTKDIVLLVKGGRIPKPAVLNSPLKESEFMPGEKVFVKGEGTQVKLRVELIGEKTHELLSTSNLESYFYIPSEAKDGQQVRITLMDGGRTGIEQLHKVIASRSNKPPVITSTLTSVNSGESVGIQLGFSDPDGPGPYTIKIVNGPGNGQLTGTGNDRKYTPNPGFEGTDQFTWQINDGIADATRPATVRITVKKQ